MRTDLSAAVDVYSDWIDACDAVAKEDMMAKNEESGGASAVGTQSRAPVGGDDDDDY